MSKIEQLIAVHTIVKILQTKKRCVEKLSDKTLTEQEQLNLIQTIKELEILLNL